MMRFSGIISIIILSLLLSACTFETSTSQEIAKDEMKQNPNVDLFLMNGSVYKKISTIKEEDLDLEHFSSLGKITSVYSGKGQFQANMSTKLPINTEIYVDQQFVMVIAKADSGFIQYQSIPEG